MSFASPSTSWLPNPANYPLHALGSILGSAVSQHAQNTGVAVESVATAGLASVMAAAQGMVDVRRPNMARSPISCLFAIIDVSGGGKDTASRPFTAPFLSFQEELNAQLGERTLAYQTLRLVWEARKRDLTRQLDEIVRDGGDLKAVQVRLLDLAREEPQPPRIHQILHGDATASGLKCAIASGSDLIFLLSMEADEIFNGPLGRSTAFLNGAYDAAVHTRTRVEGISVADHYRISALLGIQPGPFHKFLARHGQNAKDSGTLARLLITVPHSTAGMRWLQQGVVASTSSVDAAAQRILDLLGAVWGRQQRDIVEFDAGGELRFAEFFNWMQRLMAPDGDLRHLGGHAAKATEHAARIACGLHVFEGRDGPITATAFEHAAQIVVWHLGQAHSLLTPLDPDHQARADVKAVGRVVLQALSFNVREMSSSEIKGQCPGVSTGRVNHALQHLVRVGGLQPRARGRYAATVSLHWMVE